MGWWTVATRIPTTAIHSPIPVANAMPECRRSRAKAASLGTFLSLAMMSPSTSVSGLKKMARASEAGRGARSWCVLIVGA